MAAPSDRPASSGPEADDADLHGTIYSESVAGGNADPVTLESRLVNLRFHARGGLGEVFRAHDSTLNRQVAVKFIAPAQIDEQASRSRFLLEGEITGRLDHPGVVPVYGLGETVEGRPFLAMRFIDGVTLRSAIDAYHATPDRSGTERRRDLNRLLTHLIAACNAVAYAHSRGIVHRDIKPDNIMIGKFNETFVVDWGLAMPIDRDASSRDSGEESIRLASVDASNATDHGMAGTVGYIGPEALSGTAATGPESDVYSLGGTLYYLLTGRRAVSGTATAEVLDAIRRGAFSPPRALRPDVTRTLDAVCRKAMAVAPEDRYPSALALAADIEACIADEPVSALRESGMERALRWSRRHRLLVGSGVLGLLTMTLLSSLAGVWMAREAQQQQQARFAADDAKRDSLELAASFAAQTVAGEIDVRWRILEAMADDETLRRALRETDATGGDAAMSLQKWLSARQQEYRDIGADSWFVLGADGRQLARHPFQPQTIGRAFAGRDYFHGRDREYDSPPDDVKPLRKPHVSVAYVSSSDHSLKIAYSVPIWAPDDEDRLGDPVGVLAMTAKAGEFRVLKRGIGTDQLGVLVDLRPTDTADGPRGGVVLHHPDLTGRQVRRIADEGAAGKDFITAEDVTRLERLRRARIVSLDAATGPLEADPGNYTADYVDPLQPSADQRWSAAFEPVIVEGRPAEQRETFLVVLVQQREE